MAQPYAWVAASVKSKLIRDGSTWPTPLSDRMREGLQPDHEQAQGEKDAEGDELLRPRQPRAADGRPPDHAERGDVDDARDAQRGLEVHHVEPRERDQD